MEGTGREAVVLRQQRGESDGINKNKVRNARLVSNVSNQRGVHLGERESSEPAECR